MKLEYMREYFGPDMIGTRHVIIEVKDAHVLMDRYAWLREHPAWESEAFLAGLTPEEFDAAVDKARGRKS